MGLRHVLVVIRCLLIEPFPESALNEEAGRLLMEDYEQYAAHARLMTSIHAAAAKRCVQSCADSCRAHCCMHFASCCVKRLLCQDGSQWPCCIKLRLPPVCLCRACVAEPHCALYQMSHCTHCGR